MDELTIYRSEHSHFSVRMEEDDVLGKSFVLETRLPMKDNPEAPVTVCTRLKEGDAIRLAYFIHLKTGEADDLAALYEVRSAWFNEGRAPGYHREMQARVRNYMPILGRALDRMKWRP